MRSLLLIPLILSFIIVGCSSKSEKREEAEMKKSQERTTQVQTLGPEEVSKITADWPVTHQELARQLMTKYGGPNEGTSSELIWYNNGPWIKTVLKRDDQESPLVQTTKFTFPGDKLGDIALFDNSVIINPQAASITSSSMKEDYNFLTLNLANEVADGSMSPMEARRQYSQLIESAPRSEMLEDLQFTKQAEEDVLD